MTAGTESRGTDHEAGSAPLSLRGLVGPALKRAHHLLHSEAGRCLEPLGLRGATYAALSVICDRPGLRQGELAGVLSAERSNTVGTVEALEAAGWIERRRIEGDRRVWTLLPTEAGRSLCRRADALMQAQEDRMLAALPPRDRARLITLLERIAPPEG
ncbi:MarR family winged helix-turn-helix transcriptional regulator [Oceanicola sp. S124]|uniref:MarR family winged helix-turn-helix transcriptional regulator n=1 Tax=Oceanicola sp. S124 TaxID=1042378 RepID=UPI00025589A8|nr:MarR family transcriptional regulator [Oceanicola sp. S124]